MKLEPEDLHEAESRLMSIYILLGHLAYRAEKEGNDRVAKKCDRGQRDALVVQAILDWPDRQASWVPEDEYVGP
jgi:hypothetical protein